MVTITMRVIIIIAANLLPAEIIIRTNRNLFRQNSLRPLGQGVGHPKPTRVADRRGARQHGGVAHELGGILAGCCCAWGGGGQLGGVRNAG